MGYMLDGPVKDDLVEIENLTLVALYHDPIRPGQHALRLAGYTGSRIPWGVRLGGPENCQFFKDLRLQPVPGARGYRLDIADEEVLTLGLALERELDRCARYCPGQIRQHVQLPKLWAAFRPEDARGIIGDGPELDQYAARTGRSPRRLLERLCRDHLGMALYPLAWVSHRWEATVAILADLEQFPRRQVFRLRNVPDDLAGFHGAAEYDLFGIPSRQTSAVPLAALAG
jgi:hypothetical protein